jgi:ATP-dependent DNA ligase
MICAGFRFRCARQIWRDCSVAGHGIFISEFEQGEIGPDLFRKACEFGLEGLVSKHRDRPYQAGRSKHWVKVKNRKHPAMQRVMESYRDAGIDRR